MAANVSTSPHSSSWFPSKANNCSLPQSNKSSLEWPTFRLYADKICLGEQCATQQPEIAVDRKKRRGPTDRGEAGRQVCPYVPPSFPAVRTPNTWEGSEVTGTCVAGVRKVITRWWLLGSFATCSGNFCVLMFWACCCSCLLDCCVKHNVSGCPVERFKTHTTRYYKYTMLLIWKCCVGHPTSYTARQISIVKLTTAHSQRTVSVLLKES